MLNIKHKLLYANILVYCAIAIVFFVFSSDIIWGKKTFESYLLNKPLQQSADNLLLKEASENLKKKQKVDHSKKLLERSIEIDPYTNAKLLLGICHLAQGNIDKMVETCQEYRQIAPSFIGTYSQMIMALEYKKDFAAIDQLLAEGIEHFRRQITLYQPRHDPDVPEATNLKAVKIYNELQQGLKLLENMQQRYNYRKIEQ